MSYNSKIEWTETTWNPVTGCTKISIGCKNCYAERIALHLKKMGQKRYRNGFKVTLHEDVLEYPLRWKKSRIIFVNSMSDLFHEEIPEYFIRDIFSIMNQSTQHIFQVLTKRSKRLNTLASKLKWAENIWMGVTVETGDFLNRINDLILTPAKTKFISLEPLLSPMPELPLHGIDWVIVGGESGPNARPMRPEWVESVRDQCIENNTPFFFKQWGGLNKHKAGRILKGRTWDEMPNLV